MRTTSFKVDESFADHVCQQCRFHLDYSESDREKRLDIELDLTDQVFFSGEMRHDTPIPMKRACELLQDLGTV